MAEPDDLYTLRAQFWLGHYDMVRGFAGVAFVSGSGCEFEAKSTRCILVPILCARFERGQNGGFLHCMFGHFDSRDRIDSCSLARIRVYALMGRPFPLTNCIARSMREHSVHWPKYLFYPPSLFPHTVRFLLPHHLFMCSCYSECMPFI